MAGRWVEVVRLTFLGPRFRDHALDLTALSELSHFQSMLSATAKELWRTAHPQRERLPKRFDDRTRLCLRRIDPGSAVAPLEVYLEDKQQEMLWEPEPEEVIQAINLAYEAFKAIDGDTPLPERFPKRLLSDYAKWGQSLAQDEAMEIEPPRKKRVRFTPRHRERLAKFIDEPYQAFARVRGNVLEADVRQMRFQLWIDDRTAVSVKFDEEQEDLVTTALKEHNSVKVEASGTGEYNSLGTLLRLTHVKSLKIVRAGPMLFDIHAPPIEDELERIAAAVPEDEWERLPSDLTDHLDHYIYGTPKE